MVATHLAPHENRPAAVQSRRPAARVCGVNLAAVAMLSLNLLVLSASSAGCSEPVDDGVGAFDVSTTGGCVGAFCLDDVQAGDATRSGDTAGALPTARCPGTPVCAVRFGLTDDDNPWFRGPLAAVGGSPEDVILTNGLARYVIRGAAKGAAMYGTTGGNLVDVGRIAYQSFTGAPIAPVDPLREIVLTVGMHLVRADKIEIVDDGSKGEARVRVSGPLVAFPTLEEALSLPLPKLKVTHEYVLRAGTTALEVRTTLVPDGVETETALIADIMFWGGEVGLYLPGFGDQALPTTSQSDTIGFTPRRTALVQNNTVFSCAISAKKKMSTIDAGAIKAFLHGNVVVTAAGLTITRYLACGGRDGRDLAAAMAEARGAVAPGVATKQVKGFTLTPLGGVVVEVLDAKHKRLTRCDVTQSGDFSCPVPTGAVELATGWLGDGDLGLDSGGQPALGEPAPTDSQSLKPPNPARLKIKATRGGALIPVRVTLRPTEASADKLRRRFFADTDGEATHLMPPGTYDLYLNAGPLAAMHHEQVTLKADKLVTVTAELPLVVQAPGWIAADLHVHAEPSSDSSVPVDRRLAGAVVERVDYVVATDHDTPTDYRDWIGINDRVKKGAGSCIGVGALGAQVLPAIGEEVSTLKTGHFNVWPMQAGPDGAVAWFELGPEALLKAVHGGDPNRVVQCNHPRFESFSYFKAIGFQAETTAKKLLQCDLIEVINGIGHQETPQVIVDWLGLLARGIRITATGTSDCHGTSDFIGNPRTWVFVGEAAAEALCTGGATVVDKALVAGRAVASAGPMLTVKVTRNADVATIGGLLPASTGGMDNAATIEVRIAAPDWLPLGTVEVYVGQKKVKSEDVSAAVVKDGAREVALSLPMATTLTDTTVVAVHVPKPGADGWPGIHRPAWAVTNPVLIDGDGDGKWFGQAQP